MKSEGRDDAAAQRRPAAAARSYRLAGQSVPAAPIAPGLHVVSTPIGNLGDVTLRALEVLAAADLVACEDTRVTHRLMERYAIATPLTPYHDHNAAAARPKLLARLAAGEAVALVSDAGTPLISDPGYRLVRAALAAGHAVIPVPGCSAVLAALAIAGVATDRFFFEGFLPAKPAARQARIAELAAIPATLVVFETGPRIAAALADLAAALGDREAAVCRELTKLHEEVRRAGLATLARDYGAAARPRGEMVVVISGPREEPLAEAEIDARLRAALAGSSVKDAVSTVAGTTGVSRRDVYRRALALAKDHDQGHDDDSAD